MMAVRKKRVEFKTKFGGKNRLMMTTAPEAASATLVLELRSVKFLAILAMIAKIRSQDPRPIIPVVVKRWRG